MTGKQAASEDCQIPFRALIPFLVIAFGLTWGILGLYICLPNRMAGIFGQLSGQHPLFYLCVYAPAIAAFLLVFRHGGRTGLAGFLSRLKMWRCPPLWYAWLIIGLPLVFYAGSALKGTLWKEPFPFASGGALFAALVLAAIKGPVEEFGWRGLALPLLQRRLAPVWAGIVLGIIWGVWHTPAFLLSGTQQSAWAFTPFFLGCIVLSVLMTALFNAARGSILLPAFFHFQAMNPIWPDAQPYDTYILVLVTVVVLWVRRKAMFTAAGSVTEVVRTAAPTGA